MEEDILLTILGSDKTETSVRNTCNFTFHLCIYFY
jgi:hypothetical protein